MSPDISSAGRTAPAQRHAATSRCAPVLIATVLLLSACGQGATPPAASPPPAPPPPEVGVVTVASSAVNLVTDLPGRTEPYRVAQVRARVAGIVQQRLFVEGSDVRVDQPLFRLDDAPLQAALASAQAALARAEASAFQAKAQAERAAPLFEAKAISEQELVNAQAAAQQTRAEVAAAQAAVQTARINLGYAAVNAPIAGRIGRTLVTEGALVGQGEATPMALVQQIDPIYVNFTQPAADVLRLRAAIQSGVLRSAGGKDAAQVRLVLEDGSMHPQPGRLLFSDLSVDPSTGQITLRAEVPNPRGQLLPGLYVRVRLEQAQAPAAVLLPQQAVSRGAQGDSVRVVGADGIVGVRPVKVGSARDGQWVILGGLEPGEQVMVDGFQKLRGGKGPVKPVPWQPGRPSGPGPAGAGGPPAGASPASGPPAGSPPAGSPPAGSPPAGGAAKAPAAPAPASR